MMSTLCTRKKKKKKKKRRRTLRTEGYVIVSTVSRSNYIILDGSARTITLVFLRMEYLQ
jgi:hypothetical protein